ncbi:Intracellular septation protein IspA [hydrothermal vent metagenome]|uniref:Intracellular septation protein IspA n=1 Tax=hydrothermal vent metagenome TaxID=652676 RepID=A0A3B0ZS23_9ZZZZ
MKLLFDFFPVVFFYVTYNVGKNYTDEVNSIIIATAVLMVSTVIQISITWYKHRKIEKMHIIVLVMALVFGGATIYFRDAQFLIWKVSIANWLFAVVFLGSHFIGHTPVVKRMMQSAIELPEVIWNRLSYMWIIFFIALGVINLIVAENFDFDTWVDFKLFGLLGLTIIFIVLQTIYLSRHIKEVKET